MRDAGPHNLASVSVSRGPGVPTEFVIGHRDVQVLSGSSGNQTDQLSRAPVLLRFRHVDVAKLLTVHRNSHTGHWNYIALHVLLPQASFTDKRQLSVTNSYLGRHTVVVTAISTWPHSNLLRPHSSSQLLLYSLWHEVHDVCLPESLTIR